MGHFTAVIVGSTYILVMKTNNVRRPAIKYFGSKWRLAPKIISMMPSHRIYVEPYGGSACVLLRKEPSKYEIYNDLEDSIVNFFRMMRDHGEELVHRIMLTPWSRIESQMCANNLYHPDRIEWARRFYTASEQRIAPPSMDRTPHIGWRIGKGYHKGIHQLCKEDLLAVVHRLRNVAIEHKDALDVIQMHDTPHTLFYIDPPYLGAGARYVVDVSVQHLIELAEALADLDGMFILSGNNSRSYTDIYDHLGFNKHIFNEVNMTGNKTTECLWTNFEEVA